MGSISDKIESLRGELDKYLPEKPDISQKVLIIDDQHENLTAFKARFRRSATVYMAQNLDEALFCMRNEGIDIIFCDYRMPNMNGADVLSVIYKQYPKVKRVVLTAYDTLESKKEFREKSNTSQFIYKPYAYDDVFNAIFNIS